MKGVRKTWSHLPLRGKALAVALVPALAATLIAAAFHRHARLAAAAAAEMERSRCVEAQIALVRAIPAEGSAHARAYLLTGNQAFAGRARASAAHFDRSHQKLAGLLADDPRQQNLLAELDALQRVRLERLFGMQSMRQESGASLGAAIEDAEAERLRMNRILDEIGGRESARLAARLSVYEAAAARWRMAAAVGTALGVMAGLALAVVFGSGLSRRAARLGDLAGRWSRGEPAAAPAAGSDDELGDLAAALADASARLDRRRAALEGAFHGIAQLDAAGRYLSFNTSFGMLLGLQGERRGEGFLPQVDAGDRAEVEAALARARLEGRAEVECRVAAGGGRTAVLLATLVRVPADAQSGMWLLVRDVTALKENEAALLRAKDEAIATNLAKTAFLAKISHDIRTPLNAIVGTAELLSQTCLTSDQAEYVNIFQRNCRRLVALINDFLDFSKIEAGAVRIDQAPYDVREAVNHAVATFREPALRKGLELAVRIEPELPRWVVGDALRIQQVLVNLLSNAFKFTGRGSVGVAVHRVTGVRGEELRFQVSDTGPGIAPEDRQKIFTAFAQGSSPGVPPAQGCGLGLTICRELVGLMGGEISVSSQPGAGSTFTFSLPFREAQAADVRCEPVPSLPSAGRAGPIRVLVAEDIEDNQLLMKHYLRGEAIEVRFASTGQEAVEAVRSGERFDLILMDIDMPGMDGYTATRLIREVQASRGETPVPVVGLSAHAMQEAVEASLEAGCVAHISKPVDRNTLVQAIRTHAVNRRETGSITVPPEVAALVPKYLASKPRQIEQARTWLAEGDWEPIRRFGHSLRGTGSGYGFPKIQEFGGEIELAAIARDNARISRQLDALHRFITCEALPPIAPIQTFSRAN